MAAGERILNSAMADSEEDLRGLSDDELIELMMQIEMEEYKEEGKPWWIDAVDTWGSVVQAAAPAVGAYGGAIAGAAATGPLSGVGAPAGMALGGGIGSAYGGGVKSLTSHITKAEKNKWLSKIGDQKRRRLMKMAKVRAAQRKRSDLEEDRDKLRQHYQNIGGDL